MIKKYQKEIFNVLNYFSIFFYPPTFEEIYTFLPIKTTKKRLKQELERVIKQKIIKNLKLEIKNGDRYTIGEYGIKISNIKNQKSKIIKIKKSKVKSQKSKVEKNNNLIIQQFNNFIQRYQESEKKLKSWRFKFYIKLLSFFPQIKLIGLSGSLAMMNAKKEDDIDLFIITSKNRLFTGRFIAILLAELLGLRRRRVNLCFTPALNRIYSGSGLHVPRYSNKVCLNLFFDESDLQVPKFKRSLYVAHEVLQMKPVINKNHIYERFLRVNKWVKKFFPNVKILNSKFKIQNSKLQLKIQNFKFLNFILRLAFYILHFFGNNNEKLLKKIQMFLIDKHRTTEIVTNSQLWFHPDDFREKIKRLFSN